MSAAAYLSPKHQAMLYEESGIAPEIAAERGTFTARRGKDVPQEHGSLPKRPGVVFPIHLLDGGTFCRLRLNNPGRLPRYMQPKGAPNRLDVHPHQHERIKRPGGMRYATEGEKKVDAGVSRDLLMVGQSGVFNGQCDKGAKLIPDWDLLPIEGEKYSICYDSDIESNPMVQLAADRLARLLRERGAEVFITLLPPAADGSKQGLDDFFANGGTAKEIEMLTRPYSPMLIERARLSRNDKLHAFIKDLESRFWSHEWKGQGGHSDRDVYLKLVEAARRHGRLVGDGVRVVKAQGPLANESKVNARTLWKALNRLEESGLIYRDNEGRKADKPGAFVLRASVSQYGEKRGREGEATPELQEFVPGDLHLRAPRLMWSRPKFTPKRGTIADTRMVRQGPKLERRDRIERLGKVCGASIDALDQRGPMHINELAEALHKRRARDLRRRNLPMLEEAGIVTVDGDTIALADNWLEALEEQRKLGKEIEAEETARNRYKAKSKAYREWLALPPEERKALKEQRIRARADGFIRDLRYDDEAEECQQVPEVSPLASAIRDYLERNPADACQPPGWIGSTLWAYDIYPGKPTPAEVRAGIVELGGESYLRSNLERGRRAA
jgi:Domain of unknown function (DUF3854)